MKVNQLSQFFLMTALAVMLGITSGCGNGTNNNGGTTTGSGTTGGGSANVSTDAEANAALITSFISSFSVLEGTWTNTNFASSGKIDVELSFDSNTNMLEASVDIGGNVFGGLDPDAEKFEVDLSDFITNGTQTVNLTSDTYGDMEVVLTFLDDGTGTFEGTASGIPGVENGQVAGSLSVDGDTVTFSVDSITFDFGGDTITVTNDFS